MDKKLIETMYALSPAQQGMFYETMQSPGSGIHIEQFVCTLEGPLHIELFAQAWQLVTQHYAILRTAFVWGSHDEPVQIVLRQIELPVLVENWRTFSIQQQNDRLATFLQHDREQGFKMNRPPLMRITLFQSSDTTYTFIWTHHHILMDGWCSALIQKDFLHCYEALNKGQTYHPEPHRPYRDYIAWLKLQDETRAEHFWRQSLQGVRTPTHLGYITSEAPTANTEGFGAVQAVLTASSGKQLHHLVRQQRLTINTLFQGVWALLLSRYSQQQDVLFGITVSGRPPDLADSENMVGLCINTLPLRVTLTPTQPFWSWLQQLQIYNLELRQFEYIPGGKIHQWSEITGGVPLYESLLVVENYPVDSSILENSAFQLHMSNIRSIGAQTRYPLTLLVIPGTQMAIRAVYDQKRLSKTTVETILTHFLNVLTAIETSPESDLQTLQQHIPESQIPHIAPRTGEHTTPNTTRAIAEEHTELEENLLQIWQEVLGKTNLRIADNFFQSGGHSLLATQVVARIRQSLGLELPLRTLFESPTIQLLAQRIQKNAQDTRQNENFALPPLQKVSHAEPLPLSFAQHRLWFSQRMAQESSAYNSPIFVRIRGKLHVHLLQRSLSEIVQRHESLRTIYREINGQPIQIVMPATTQALPQIDLREFPSDQREKKALTFATEEGKRLFNLEQSPLIRTVLLQISDDEHVLLTTIHHIATDAWSAGIYLRELLSLYEAYTQEKPTPLPELPAQYADFALWQRNWLEGKELERHTTYWQQQLRGARALEMPTDRPRPTVATFAGASQPFAFSQALSQQIQQLSQQEGVTTFMTLLTAFKILLYRYTNQEDIVLGTDIANRTLKETELMIGFFVNLLVLRTNLAGKPSFIDALKRVREMLMGAYTYQNLPFEKLVEALHLERSLNHTPLIRTLFVMQNIPLFSGQAAGITLSPFHGELVTAKFDFVIFLFETPQGLQGSVNYSTELFNAETIQTLMQRFEVLLQHIVAQPQTPIEALEFHTEQEQVNMDVKKTENNNKLRNKLRSTRREEISLPS